MLFAFSRDRAVPGHQLWRFVSRHRVPIWAAVGAGVFGFVILIPTWWNNLLGYYVGTSVGTTGLYIAFILPVILRFRAGSSFEHGSWSLGNHYKWINVIAILWVVFISVIFMLPTVAPRDPGEHGLHLERRQLRATDHPRAFILFGGWWVLSANKWFKGPVRMGTEIELEQIEVKQEDEFALPADTEFGST